MDEFNNENKSEDGFTAWESKLADLSISDPRLDPKIGLSQSYPFNEYFNGALEIGIQEELFKEDFVELGQVYGDVALRDELFLQTAAIFIDMRKYNPEQHNRNFTMNIEQIDKILSYYSHQITKYKQLFPSFKSNIETKRYFTGVWDRMIELLNLPYMEDYLSRNFLTPRPSITNYTKQLESPASFPSYSSYYVRNKKMDTKSKLHGIQQDIYPLGTVLPEQIHGKLDFHRHI